MMKNKIELSATRSVASFGCKAACVIAAITALSGSAMAQDSIAVVANGQPISFAKGTPIVENGRVLVPFRGLMETLGASVQYSDATRSLQAIRGATDVEMTLGERKATVNQKEVSLDTPATSRDGVVLLPLRFVGEQLGAKVSYDPLARMVNIDTDTEKNDSSRDETGLASSNAQGDTTDVPAPEASVDPMPSPAASVAPTAPMVPGTIEASPSPSPEASPSASPSPMASATPVAAVTPSTPIGGTRTGTTRTQPETTPVSDNQNQWIPWVVGIVVVAAGAGYLMTRQRGGKIIATNNDK